MNDFNDQYSAFLNEFGNGKKMVLSTSLNDKVTSRMMSVIHQNGIFYFQTDKHLRKYDQLIKNENVALCIDNIQIEGICKELGHPLENPDFCSQYKECFASSFERYSSLSNEVLFAVTPLHLERWLYKDGTPFVESFDIANREYCIYEYQGDQNQNEYY